MTDLDENDRRILDLLRRDSRMSARDMAERLGMRPSTVHERIKRMREQGVIQAFTVKLDPAKTGRGLAVFMLVAGSMEEYLDAKLLSDARVEEVHGITGEYDLLVKMRFKDMRDFNSFLIQFRKTYKDHIRKTITMVETANLKED